MAAIKRLNSVDAGFKTALDDLLAFEGAQDDKIEQTVANILADVRTRGDAAVIEYTNRFDRLILRSIESQQGLEPLREIRVTAGKALDGDHGSIAPAMASMIGTSFSRLSLSAA